MHFILFPRTSRNVLIVMAQCSHTQKGWFEYAKSMPSPCQKGIVKCQHKTVASRPSDGDLFLPSFDAHSAFIRPRGIYGRITGEEGACLFGCCKPSSSRHQANIKPTSSEDARRMHATCTEGNAQNWPYEQLCFSVFVIVFVRRSQALLPPFSRRSHTFGKVLPSPWSLLGLGNYLATPWEPLGYPLGRAWVQRACALGEKPCGKINFTIWHFLRSFANPYACV